MFKGYRTFDDGTKGGGWQGFRLARPMVSRCSLGWVRLKRGMGVNPQATEGALAHGVGGGLRRNGEGHGAAGTAKNKPMLLERSVTQESKITPNVAK